MKPTQIALAGVLKDLLFGMFFGAVGFAALALAFSVAQSGGVEPDWGGDKAQVLWALLFALPAGTTGGIAIARRKEFHSAQRKLVTMALAVAMGMIGAVTAVVLTRYFGSYALFTAIPMAAILGEIVFLAAGFRRT